MASYVQPKSDFLNKVWVDQNIKKLVEEPLLWEKLLTHQSVDSPVVRYYREQYLDISTPNDSAMSRPLDYVLKSPGIRAPGGTFPHTDFGAPTEYSLGLYQIGLEVDVTDEAQKYAQLENQIVKAQTKLANAFGSRVNEILGNALTETWTTSGSAINYTSLSSGQVWSNPTATDCRPIRDVLDAMEKIEDIAGYSYAPSAALVSKQSYFDLRLWLAEHNYNYKDQTPFVGPATAVTSIEGIPFYSSNMVKRDYAVIGDFKAAGTLFEAEPLTTNQYYTDEDHITHIQAFRTFNFALTDPKAICLIVNTA
jgi:hypothetical protein